MGLVTILSESALIVAKCDERQDISLGDLLCGLLSDPGNLYQSFGCRMEPFRECEETFVTHFTLSQAVHQFRQVTK